MTRRICWMFGVFALSTTWMTANAQNWVSKSPQTSPSARFGQAMAYDAAHGQVVMFGGAVDGNTEVSETWVWDGANWTQKHPANSPYKRFGHAMAYDAAHGQVVLFGGYTGGSASPDTWVWDGTTWTQKNPQNKPQPRFFHAMAYDSAHGQVVLFGGSLVNRVDQTDTWVWDGNNWTEKSPQIRPPARSDAGMAYDAAHGQMILFGGRNDSVLSDTWAWDGTQWTQKLPQSSPPARFGGSLAYDTSHRELVSFGGEDNSSSNSDTWVWDGDNWNQKHPQTNPSARSGAMAYDSAHGQMVLFGGLDRNDHAFGDTWVWNHGIFASAGNPQSTPAGTGFSFPLEVTVVDNNGVYVQGAQVTFAGPPTMVSFSSMIAMTDSTGRAHVTATATASAGSYLVTASLSGGDFAEFMLSNVNTAGASGPCQVTTALDDNSGGSLRSQVATCGKGGTITFASGITRVVVSQGQDIQLTQDLTIDGGAGVTIDAGSSSRIFFMFGGYIKVKSLALRNGLAKGGDGGNGPHSGGGAAGMGGAVFVNGGTLVASNVSFSGNQARGGNGGAFENTSSAGGGGGVGGDGSGNNGIGNGGGGGDFGASGGACQNLLRDCTGGDGSGGGNSFGGFGGGGGSTSSVGFSGGFGGGGGVASLGGAFGGGGSTMSDGGGGAGLGGGIFVRNGMLVLASVSFSSNSAIKGNAGGGNATDGQGKGGALFIMSGAQAFYFGSAPTFNGDSATDQGGTPVDNNDYWGSLSQATITTSGTPQSAKVGTAFANPLTATITAGGSGVGGLAVTFTGPSSGASIIPASQSATTNSSGLASVPVSANATIGGPYAVTATFEDVATLATYSLTNTFPTTLSKTAGDNQSTRIGTAYATNLKVTVLDQVGMPFPGAMVTFTIVQGGSGASGTFAGTPAQPIATGADGTATAPVLTANMITGQFTVMVAVANTGLTQTFTLTSLAPDLTIAMSHPGGTSGHFSQGQTDATYSIMVGNSGPIASLGVVTVTEKIPAGLTLISMAGTGWTCGSPNAANVCTRSDAAASGGGFPQITVTVSVSASAPATLTNVATVAGGGELNTANDQASDPTTINAIVDVTSRIKVTQTGFGRNRTTGFWSATMTVMNTGATSIGGPIRVVFSNLTAGVTMVSPDGTRNGSPYITVVGAGSLAPGASVTMTIQFMNPNNAFIDFTPVTQVGVF